jgi:hypothetical protein
LDTLILKRSLDKKNAVVIQINVSKYDPLQESYVHHVSTTKLCEAATNTDMEEVKFLLKIRLKIQTHALNIRNDDNNNEKEGRKERYTHNQHSREEAQSPANLK